MPAVLEIIQKTTEFLAGKGVEPSRLNAEHLVGHTLGLGRMQLYLQFERVLTEGELEKIRSVVRRRAQREPLQHILGTAEFFGLKLKTDRRALIPRPETERLVELVTQLWPEAPASVLDLGTGSGAIALALAAHWPNTRAMAVDQSVEALALAAENAEALHLADRITFVASDWCAALPPEARFDLIVANPPYLNPAELAAAEPEVRLFDPPGALVAGDDGLADLRRILKEVPARLNPGGLLALETGIAQHAELLKMAAGAGLSRAESRPDLTGRDRFLLAWR